MPVRFANDPECVTQLLDESERVTNIANKWATAKIPNIIASRKAMEIGWAYALAAVFLRAKQQPKPCRTSKRSKNSKRSK